MSQNVISAAQSILPEQKAKKSFGALGIYPEKIQFETQNPGEIIFILVRSHFITNLGWILQGILAIAIPIVTILLSAYLSTVLPAEFTNLILQIHPGMWVILGLIYYSTVITFMFAHFVDWYFNVYLITSERFLNIHFRFLRGKTVSEARLEHIQEITQRTIGFFPAIFNYGDVIAETAAAQKGKFLFKSVPDPDWFRDVLSDLSLVAKQGEP